MSEAYFPRVQTVTGALPVSLIQGAVLPGEHLRTDTRWGTGGESDPYRWLDEETHVTSELAGLGREQGLALVVEHTCLGMGRDVAALARVATAARIAVVAATGFAPEPFSGDLIRRYGVDDLTADLLKEIGTGLDGTAARPGVIVAAAWDERPTPAEARAITAAARASARTDLPVAADGLDVLESLLAEGLPPARLSARAADPLVQRKIAESGAYVAVTEAEHALALVEAGHAARVLISAGVSRQGHLRAYGGRGYGRLFDEVVPALGAAGTGPDVVELITHHNPLRWLTGLDR
ncbi:aryldialkylphosphatase [Microtetraspora niveoalba]|uniref:phosphotriesterase family protein n=1 Tax=Microtetraspora niveoalba TaxID=46175 RepID=UPI00082F2F86|nr:aryldialkylphosphatase [Microtetraspora niveoalba]